MGARDPRLTVAVPVFNGERYLPELFACLQAQTFRDFEIVIVDNASSDRTAALCQSFVASNRRVRYHRNATNIGAAPNFNRTFELARGSYVKWAAYDDVFAPEYLARCVEVLDDDPSAVLCHSETVFTDAHLRPLPYDPRSRCYLDAASEPRVLAEPPGLASTSNPVQRFDDVLHRLHFCIEVFGVIRSAALARTSLHGSYYGSDKVLLAELALLGRFARVTAPLFSKRVHERTTLYFTTRERDDWIDPSAHHRLPQLQVLKGYLQALHRAELTRLERLRCLESIGAKFFALDVLKRLVLPRPDNYFGWRSEPTSRDDTTRTISPRDPWRQPSDWRT